MASEAATLYKSGSQQARVVTEPWGASNLYCPNCPSPKIDSLKNNTKAVDFKCPACGFWYQLKGQKTKLGGSISDGNYKTMMEAIHNDRTPNFFFMHYELPGWNVRSLLLVPHFAFPLSAIIKRKPLSPSARRAGWIGCNIALSQIPQEARIFIVIDHQMQPVDEVRKKFLHIKPLAYFPAAERGWTLDVLTAVRSLNKPEFTNSDAYTLAPHLEKLHPGNRHIKDKIRQQLQNLRDAGLVEHVARGSWRVR